MSTEIEKQEKDLVVSVGPTEVKLALMENHRLIEFSKESSQGHSYSVGDVFLGRVKKVMPALNAAFVDIGDSKEAFIHYLDLGLYFHAFDTFVKKSNPNTDLKALYSSIPIGPALEKEGHIEKELQVGQMIICQIVKEPISTKGSRLTAEISLAGRNIVLLPFAQKVSVSSKISSKEERKRLETLVRNILPRNYGAIIRTASEGKNAAVLVAEAKSLIEKWEESWKQIARSKGIELLFTEYSKTTTMLRDLLNDTFNKVYVDDEVSVAELTYGRGYYSMMIVMPKDIGQQITDKTDWWGLHNKLVSATIAIRLPTFKVQNEVQNIVKVCQQLGINKLFDVQSNGVCYVNMGQSAMIDVDENGTKAAAVSYAEGLYTSDKPTGPIKFDHPFVYAIRENTTGTILFIGKVGQL